MFVPFLVSLQSPENLIRVKEIEIDAANWQIAKNEEYLFWKCSGKPSSFPGFAGDKIGEKREKRRNDVGGKARLNEGQIVYA